MSEYAGLHILKNPFHIDNAYDYFIPPHLRGSISVGDFVAVPFGNSNKREIALVISLKDFPEKTEKSNINYKPILSLCDKKLSLSQEMLGLCLFMKEQCLCSVGDAVRAMMPSAALTDPHEVIKIAQKYEKKIPKGIVSEPARLIGDFVREKGKVEPEVLISKYSEAAQYLFDELFDAEIIYRDYEIKDPPKKFESYYSLAISREDAEAIVDRSDKFYRIRSKTQIAVIKHLLSLKDGEEASRESLTDKLNATYTHFKPLLDKGILTRTTQEIDRGIAIIKPALNERSKQEIQLNEDQLNAYNTLRSLSDSKDAKAALLYGITGSGKTSVMLKIIDYVLSKKEQAIVLLPEISLTPQTLGIFCSRYGERVAIIHSGLSAGERLDTFRRIKSGGADIVIGTRSAVFAPLPRLGLIVIDEEQEHTYKSDQNPKYHARDVARFRCAKSNALMLLASATPSFESFYKAEEGKYTLIKMTHRYGKAKLPKVTVVDMRKSGSGGMSSPLGNTLCEKLLERIHKGEQSILFLNRRGYNNFISCQSCGNAISCPTCSVSMTYHTYGKAYNTGELRCHWCGKRIPLPMVCPQCGSEHLTKMGYGTQRVEQELTSLLPLSRIIRMDTDTTSTKSAYDKLLGQFRSREADVLLGTQMVTKGHDFPAVTLVGVLSADASLYLDDYRAAEKTFAMLTQVIGRAGRADREGEAIIQTSNPDHECIRLACSQNYEDFYRAEIRLRKELCFPPFCDIAVIALSSSLELALQKASQQLSSYLIELSKSEFSDVPLVIFGPFEAPVYKVDNKYRIRTVIKCRLNKRSRELFTKIIKNFSTLDTKNVNISVDFNPSTL